jgi:NADH dehydrogenase
VEVDDRMAVKGMQGVWAVGDCAAVPDRKRGFSPPAAQYAIRQAKVVAANIASELGVGEPRTYTYSSKTAFVNLGRYKAVGRLGRFTFSGFLAWWLARTYHLSQIPGAVRKLRAVIDWTVSLPFQRDLSEVGSIGHPRPLRDEAYELGGSHRPLDAG